jgi:hypothetical protein
MVDERVFGCVLKLVAEQARSRDLRIGVDALRMQADASPGPHCRHNLGVLMDGRLQPEIRQRRLSRALPYRRFVDTEALRACLPCVTR